MEDNRLIVKFLGYKILPNVANWSIHNDKTLTEHWNNKDGVYSNIPKGKGQKWYKVLHRGNYYQLFTDFTYQKVDSKDIEEGYTDGKGDYTLLVDSDFHTNWNSLMMVVRKIVSDMEFNSSKPFLEDNEYRESIMDIVPFGDIKDTYDAILEFIKWYNKNI